MHSTEWHLCLSQIPHSLVSFLLFKHVLKCRYLYKTVKVGEGIAIFAHLIKMHNYSSQTAYKLYCLTINQAA